jgi:hypothetical protein
MALLGELHPLALLPSSSPALAGLGLRAQLVLPFWGEIAHVLRRDSRRAEPTPPPSIATIWRCAGT